MAYFVKVIPPSKRARIHSGECKFCRDGQGMENQDKGSGPTYWHPSYPSLGLETVAAARNFMDNLGPRYDDKGLCSYCMKEDA
ncbi:MULTISPECIES: hypothetical protein [unclassified Rhizobium]|uniref:hypothetical protein n=1 Tax=unclassified Rhizobium TaxID=2613769 RepID=UPI00115E788D|nr:MULTISPECIES: hypothetical protein [unclassified Rhizobium]TQX90244.1 hypothetical protein EQW76_11110 [Rhizobium sp. rho-13.1]TQY16194.1 hypothetical protein EQW74_10700 [Rhizobium sp. rho-1.1]